MAVAFSLAECYTDGIGVDPDRDRAEYWYNKALGLMPEEQREEFRCNNPFPLHPSFTRNSVIDSVRQA